VRGRFTVKMTWAEIVVLYRLTMEAPPHNVPPRYNVCPTVPVDVVRKRDGRRELVPMRWGLDPTPGGARWPWRGIDRGWLRARTGRAAIEVIADVTSDIV
jgi:putative SOS response-associated peptidase YedK